jgi:hypothetical protein
MSEAPKERPIYSTRADDPTAEASIQAFVVTLAERIDALQDAQRCGELGRLAVQARALVLDADARGFESLARTAEMLVTRCREEDAEGALKELVELTGIARRIRLGHPGAM